MTLRFGAFPEAELPGPIVQQVRALQEQAWPSDGPVPSRPIHDPLLSPLNIVALLDDRVVASVDVLTKRITHADRTFLASGLSAVVTDREHRGRGYGLALVTHARDLIRATDADLTVFTCDRPLAAFYERAGFRELKGAVIVGGTPNDPFPSDRPEFDKVTMVDLVSAAVLESVHEFENSRIELYPGAIDILW